MGFPVSYYGTMQSLLNSTSEDLFVFARCSHLHPLLPQTKYYKWQPQGQGMVGGVRTNLRKSYLVHDKIPANGAHGQVRNDCVV